MEDVCCRGSNASYFRIEVSEYIRSPRKLCHDAASRSVHAVVTNMAELMTLELHYPTNWAYEGEVDVLYSDGSGEMSYGRLAQGQTMSRETYPGHRWVVREAASRELLMSIVSARPAGGGAQPQCITIGSDGGLDPLKAAVWRMGRAPREPLLKATEVLLKLLQNVLANPAEPKYRTLRISNPTVTATVDVPGKPSTSPSPSPDRHCRRAR